MIHFSQALLDSIPVGLLLTDADLVVRQMNRWLRVRLAAEPEAHIGRPLGEAFPELEEHSLLAAYALVRESGTSLRLSAATYRFVVRLPAPPDSGLSEMPQSTTLVPLLDEGAVVGILTMIVDRTERHQTELQLQREVDKLTALHAIDHALATLDLPACLQIIIERTRVLFQAENASLLLVQGQRLTVAADAGYPQSYVGHSIAITAGLSGWCVAHQASTLVPDTRQDPHYLSVDPRIRSEMTTPLLLRGECLGVLNVESRRLAAFTEADVELLETLGARAAAAIHNARLHAAEREQRVLADTLRDITLALASELNSDAILDVLLDQVARVTPYDSAAILLYEPLSGRIHIGRSSGYERLGLTATAATFTAPLSDFPNMHRMAHQRRPEVVPDTHGDPEWVVTEVSRHIRSWAGAPIVARGQLLGFLSLEKLDALFYTAEMAERLAIFAAAAGLALENARLYAEQQRLAITDGLTGIANRRQFDLVLRRELARSRRFGRPLGLILLDIDDFKHFNDMHGHLAGDELLQALALLLSQSIRTIDCVARYGGEEFAVVLPEADRADAAQVAERLREVVGGLPVAAGPGAITISLGVAVTHQPELAVEALLQTADRALYEAKRAGKNRVVVYGD